MAKLPDAIPLKPEGVLYQVVDKDGTLIGKPLKTLRRALRKADKLDLEYGAYRYTVRRIYPEAK